MSPSIKRLPRRLCALLGALCLSLTASADIVRNAPPLPVQKEGAWDTLKLVWSKPEKDGTHWGNPIGNGFVGAKIKGGVETEILQLNDKTFWSDWPRDTQDPRRKAALELTRQKLADGDIPGANGAARGMWGPSEPGSYLPLGKLVIHFDGQKEADTKNYRRELDLDRAVSTVSYTLDGVTYTREAFASHPDKIIVMRVSASQKGKLNLISALQYPVEMEGHAFLSAEDNVLVMKGKAPGADRKTFDAQKGMTFETRVAVLATGGRASTQDNKIRVEGADSVVFIIANATSYNGYRKEPGTEGVDPSPLVKAMLNSAVSRSYDTLVAVHLQDYRALFRRLWLEINKESPSKYALGLQYARYDMIAVSRTGDRPHNQQGMWSHEWKASSNCCHFLNENVQKYYGLIETANIADCGLPLWNWMEQLAERGGITAKSDWGFRGWMAPHYSDIWATTTLKGGNNEWTIWPMGGVWLCQNLWDHYAFSGDKEFLSKRAYPLMKGAAEFSLDYLVEDSKGRLVTSPSTSPENQFRLIAGGPTFAVCQGSTMDIALIRELFENCIMASQILGVDADFRDKLKAANAKMLPYQIGANGELQEWSADYVKRDNGHRHASHAVAVWPLRQITQRDTPELFRATLLTLDNRGGGGYHPDKAAMYARLGEGDKALSSRDAFYTGGGLAGQFPPKYAALPEMLVQSHLLTALPTQDAKIGNLPSLSAPAFEIVLLPALPASWANGKVNGLRARGGYEISVEWVNGELKSCRIDSILGTMPTVRYRGELLDIARDSRVTVNLLK